MTLGWRVAYEGKTPPPGSVVRPDERLSWPRTVGLGAQHVVAMFGATFVFPVVMGLNPQLAIMMSGIATICFLLIVKNKVPSYLGTSASFVGGVAAIRAQGGDDQHVTGAILIAGVVLLAVGVLIHFLGAQIIHAVLPPVVTGAVVLLIGFNLAPVVANVYWPQDQWIALITMLLAIGIMVGVRGFIGRIAIFLALVFGYVLSWLADRIFGKITSYDSGAGHDTTHWRVDFDAVKSANWIGFPTKTSGTGVHQIAGRHFPEFKWAFILLVLPAVIALVAENTGHVKAVAEMTGDDLDPYMGRAIAADGFGTAVAGTCRRLPDHHLRREHRRHGRHPRLLHGGLLRRGARGDPVRPLPEVRRPGRGHPRRRARRHHRRALRHDRPARGEDLDREPGRLRQPVNLVPIAAGVIIGIGNTSLKFTDNFSLSGIALGTDRDHRLLPRGPADRSAAPEGPRRGPRGRLSGASGPPGGVGDQEEQR